MACRAVHDPVAIASGAVAAMWCSPEDGSGRLLEAIGGCVGGWAGGRLPDVLNPPIHPNHRTWAHGIVPVGGTGGAIWYYELIPTLQQKIRNLAEEQRLHRDAAGTGLEAFLRQLLEWVLLIAAGVIAGIAAGYASHILLDATTAKGLPIIA